MIMTRPSKNSIHKEDSSFRDPDGFIFYKDQKVYRHINCTYKKDYDLLKHSGCQYTDNLSTFDLNLGYSIWNEFANILLETTPLRYFIPL